MPVNESTWPQTGSFRPVQQGLKNGTRPQGEGRNSPASPTPHPRDGMTLQAPTWRYACADNAQAPGHEMSWCQPQMPSGPKGKGKGGKGKGRKGEKNIAWLRERASVMNSRAATGRWASPAQPPARGGGGGSNNNQSNSSDKGSRKDSS